jgi:hypothetical protein
MEPVRIAEALREYPGKWVAIKDGQVVEARETADQLALALHDRDVTGATIIRSPGEDEPELVGLG